MGVPEKKKSGHELFEQATNEYVPVILRTNLGLGDVSFPFDLHAALF